MPRHGLQGAARKRVVRAAAAGLLGLAALPGCMCDRRVALAGFYPPTTTAFVDRLALGEGTSSVDLLFVVDNSLFMADKQQLLTQAVPTLVAALLYPGCVDTETGERVEDTSAADCPEGTEPAFEPVQDLHIGVITSSLGGHGGVLCSPERQSGSESYFNPTQDDRGRLIQRAADGSEVATCDDQGFLAWDASGEQHDPPAESDAVALASSLQQLILGAGEQGCSHEATLEAWYRFLIDPMPPLAVVKQMDESIGQEVSVPVGVDDVLLEQRAQFLRPDSIVAIVMLTDEDDCSVMDSGIGWYVGNIREGSMPRSTTQCDTDPNHPCCLSCIQSSYPDECSDPRDDPKCSEPLHEATNDRLNLRCYNHKQRFGLDFLYPTERYVDALTPHQIEGYDGEWYTNPLFDTNAHYPELVPRMDSSRIFLAGIVGVPWQDLATDESLAGPELEYLHAAELTARDLWSLMLGEPEASPPVLPADPFMIESVAPRSGANPRTGTAIAPPVEGAGGPALNGHECDIQGNNDLQYACIFELETAKECADVEPGVGCDCGPNSDIFMRPVCDGTTQTHAKAYPGLRLLQVLKDYGNNSIVASICPKHPVGTETDPYYGYNPAMRATVDRLAEQLRDACLPRAMAADENGQVLCQLYEATPAGDPAPCGAGFSGREWAPDGITLAVLRKMRDLEMCVEPDLSCTAVSVCGLPQLPPGPDREACLHDLVPRVSTSGWCFIDAMTDRNRDGELHCTSECYQNADPGCDCLGNPELVRRCPLQNRQRIRFVNAADGKAEVPWPSAQLFVSCTEPAFRAD